MIAAMLLPRRGKLVGPSAATRGAVLVGGALGSPLSTPRSASPRRSASREHRRTRAGSRADADAAVATVLFAPIAQCGTCWAPTSRRRRPGSVTVVLGAAVLRIACQLAGGCGSGCSSICGGATAMDRRARRLRRGRSSNHACGRLWRDWPSLAGEPRRDRSDGFRVGVQAAAFALVAFAASGGSAAGSATSSRAAPVQDWGALSWPLSLAAGAVALRPWLTRCVVLSRASVGHHVGDSRSRARSS